MYVVLSHAEPAVEAGAKGGQGEISRAAEAKLKRVKSHATTTTLPASYQPQVVDQQVVAAAAAAAAAHQQVVVVAAAAALDQERSYHYFSYNVCHCLFEISLSQACFVCMLRRVHVPPTDHWALANAH